MKSANSAMAIKDLINFLFDNIRHPDGRPYTSQEVSEQVRISHATINQLRTGRNKNPTLPTLQEICGFFDVPLSFFEASSFDDCLKILGGQRIEISPTVAHIALRASNLSAKSQEDVLTILDWVEAAERERSAGRDVPNLPFDRQSS